MTSLVPKRTLYPQWHKKYVSPNPELEKRIRQFQKERLEKERLEKENLRKERLSEYSFIDDRWYYFTWNDFQNYLTNKDFNIEKCFIPNIIEREKREEKERIKREEEERIIQERKEMRELEYLRNYDENDYLNYFYEGEPFTDHDDNSDNEQHYSSDDNLY